MNLKGQFVENVYIYVTGCSWHDLLTASIVFIAITFFKKNVKISIVILQIFRKTTSGAKCFLTGLVNIIMTVSIHHNTNNLQMSWRYRHIHDPFYITHFLK